MEIEDCEFAQADIDAHSLGAGILPYAIKPDGSLHVLLGRERYAPLWRGSCRWSGFEGSRQAPELIAQTATREFAEESLGVVLDSETVERLLEEHGHTMRIVLRILHDRRPERYHCTYVVQIPWDPAVVERFEEWRARLEHISRLSQEWSYQRRPSVLQNMKHIGPIAAVAEGVEIECERDEMPCIIQGAWSLRPDGTVLARVGHGPLADNILAWERVRSRLQSALRPHPAVGVERDERYGLVQKVTVAPEYLEKDSVRWWSLGQLDAVLDGHGTYHTERFRPYFLPVLQTFLREIRTQHGLCAPADGAPLHACASPVL